MPYETIIYEKEAGIATLMLNRPEVMNTWNKEMGEETISVIEEINRDEDVRVLIITGTGRAFSAGADVGQLKKALDGNTSFSDLAVGQYLMDKPNVLSVMLRLYDLDRPVIAAINGAAAGAGLSLALTCDMRIAADNARFSMAFVKRGLNPDCGATYWLTRIVGPSMALKLMLTGDVIDAKEAERIGLVDQLVPTQDLMTVTRELAQRIAKNPPLAVKMTKRLTHQGINESSFKDQVDREVFIYNAIRTTEDFKEGIDSFLEKREPRFTGR